MMHENPLVSIITINYNEIVSTCNLIESLLNNNNYKNIEIIVVDNCSTMGNVNIITQKFPQVNLIKSKVNLGFSGGNNLGYAQANGEYIFFLNNDTVVDKNCISQLLNVFNGNKNVGLLCPRIYFANSNKTIQYAGYTKLNPYTLRNRAIGYMEKDIGQYNLTVETNFAHGAAMMTKKSIIDEVGLMEEIYFLYYEELDWANKFKAKNYKIYSVHNSIVYHNASLSTGKNSPLKTYYMTRNRIIYARKNLHGIQLLISIIYQILIVFPKSSFFFLMKKEWQNIKSTCRGLLWNLKNFNLNFNNN